MIDLRRFLFTGYISLCFMISLPAEGSRSNVASMNPDNAMSDTEFAEFLRSESHKSCEQRSKDNPVSHLNYDSKYKFFRKRVPVPLRTPTEKFEMTVRRSSILQDSYHHISKIRNPAILKRKLAIKFQNEKGMDVGGVARDWLSNLSKEIFHPKYGLFEYCDENNYGLLINPMSFAVEPDYLNYYYFCGRITGIAVLNGFFINASFSRIFFKTLLGKCITLRDIQRINYASYSSLKWIKDNDPSCLGLTFSVEEEFLGNSIKYPLKKNGANIKVTKGNKMEYIRLFLNWKYMYRVQEQMSQFLKGLNEIIPNYLIQIFDEYELEMLLCGVQKIDVEDWKRNTVYTNGYNAAHHSIKHFWKVVESFNNEQRGKLLQFLIGTSRVPVSGFKELQGAAGRQLFTIQMWGTEISYPVAHTCFNRLDLPPYKTFKVMKERISTALKSGPTFDIA